MLLLDVTTQYSMAQMLTMSQLSTVGKPVFGRPQPEGIAFLLRS